MIKQYVIHYSDDEASIEALNYGEPEPKAGWMYGGDAQFYYSCATMAEAKLVLKERIDRHFQFLNTIIKEYQLD